jgi:hypothetical protein
MKSAFSLILILATFNITGQTPEIKKERKYTVGVYHSPFQLTYWFWSDLKAFDLVDEDPPHITLKGFYPVGFYFNYKLNSLLKFNTAFSFSGERFIYDAVTNKRIVLKINYNIQYLTIPISVNYYPWHKTNKEAIGGFFIQPALNFDFLIHENIRTETSEWQDFHYPAPPGGRYYPPPTIEESNSVKFRFNRICPSFAMGREIVGEKLSFWYSGKGTFASVYQLHNTQEYFRNIRFGINIGLGYRF